MNYTSQTSLLGSFFNSLHESSMRNESPHNIISSVGSVKFITCYLMCSLRVTFILCHFTHWCCSWWMNCHVLSWDHVLALCSYVTLEADILRAHCGALTPCSYTSSTLFMVKGQVKVFLCQFICQLGCLNWRPAISGQVASLTKSYRLLLMDI